jgi:hypothetical protein
MHPLLTRHLLLHRYPFFSVDSATWAKQSAVGQIHLPVYRAGKPDYTVPPDLLALTERSRRRTGVRHIDDGDELLLARLEKYLSNEVGFDLNEARQHARGRWLFGSPT